MGWCFLALTLYEMNERLFDDIGEGPVVLAGQFVELLAKPFFAFPGQIDV
jgi:hypothetical protein